MPQWTFVDVSAWNARRDVQQGMSRADTQGCAAVLDVGPGTVLHTHLIMDGLQVRQTLRYVGWCMLGAADIAVLTPTI